LGIQLVADIDWVFMYEKMQTEKLYYVNDMGTYINLYISTLCSHLQGMAGNEMTKEALKKRFLGCIQMAWEDEDAPFISGDHFTELTSEGVLKIWVSDKGFMVNINYPPVGCNIESQL
jgi:hypothetical protein